MLRSLPWSWLTLPVLVVACQARPSPPDPASSAASAAATPVPGSGAPSASAAPAAAPSLALAASAPIPVPSAKAAAPSASARRGASGCPPEMAPVGRACVDRWEAHLQEQASGRRHPHQLRPHDGVTYFAISAPDVYPQAYISRGEAEAACAAAGKRLCTLREWYQACRGTKRSTYPYGVVRDRKACNSSKPHLLSKKFGTNARRWSYDDHFNSPEMNLEPGFLEKTGFRKLCTSDYGTFDMVGNLHEWVADRVDRSLPRKVKLRKDIEKKLKKNWGHGIFMGGFFSTTSEHGRGCHFTTIGHGVKYHDYSTGFRCCLDRASE